MSFTALTPSEGELRDFYGGTEPGDVPLYTLSAVARHLRLPGSTVHWWARGRPAEGHAPIISEPVSGLLSFNHLIELYVVKALMRGRNVPLQAVRRAIDYAANEMDLERVLLSGDLFTFGDKLLLRHLGSLVDITRSGQLALERVVVSYMKRIDRSAVGLPLRLHPDFTSETMVHQDYPISLSPLVAFGEPTLTGTAIKTAVVAARVDSGESPTAVADDYGVDEDLITNALVFENAA